MYGLGELRTPGTLQTRSMGGVGVGMRNAAAVNLLNPAAYSAVRPKSFLFDFGLEGQCFYNSQKYYGQTLNTSYYTSIPRHCVSVADCQAFGVGLQPDALQQRRLPDETGGGRR